MKLIEKYRGRFRHGMKEFGYKHLLELYKTGTSFSIRNEHDVDVTKESLIVAIFGEIVPVDYVASIISNEDVDDIIHAGGYDNWTQRRRK